LLLLLLLLLLLSICCHQAESVLSCKQVSSP